MLKETTIHGQNANDLFEKYQEDGKGNCRRIISNRPGKWMPTSPKVKQLLQNHDISKTTKK